MKRQLSITVRGKQHEWTFHFDGNPKHLAEWREDGLIVNESTILFLNGCRRA